MNLKTDINGFKVLGHLISLRVKEHKIPLKEYNEMISNLVDNKAQPQSFKKILGASPKSDNEAFVAAEKNLKTYDSKISRKRFFTRVKPDAKDPSIVVIREVYGDGTKCGTRDPIAIFKLDNSSIKMEPNKFDNEAIKIYQKMELDLKNSFEHEKKTISGISIRSKINKIIDECLPAYYDAEHVIKFLSVENNNRIEFISDIIDKINEMAGVSSLTRDKKSSIAVVPMADIGDTKTMISDSIEATISEMQGFVKDTIDTLDNDETNSQKIVAAINKSKKIKEMVSNYKGMLLEGSKKMDKLASKSHDKLRRALGSTDEASPKRPLSWKTALKRMAPIHGVLGIMLVKHEYTKPILKSHMEFIAFDHKEKGIRITQTDLKNENSSTIDISNTKSIPEKLFEYGFYESDYGFSYTGIIDIEMAGIINEWWIK